MYIYILYIYIRVFIYIYGIAAILWQSLAKPLTLSASTVCKCRAKVPHITSGHFSRATPESTRGTSDHFRSLQPFGSAHFEQSTVNCFANYQSVNASLNLFKARC